MKIRRSHITAEPIKPVPMGEEVDDFQFEVEDDDLSVLHFQHRSAPESPEIVVRAVAANQRLELLNNDRPRAVLHRLHPIPSHNPVKCRIFSGGAALAGIGQVPGRRDIGFSVIVGPDELE
jgi:hypothetical protein